MNSMSVKSYKKMEVESASPGKLLLMLYDGALEFLELAMEYAAEENTHESRRYIQKVQAIVTELMASLNMDAGEISGNLFLLYEYVIRMLLDAYNTNDKNNLSAVREILSDLRESWTAIVNGTVSDQVGSDSVGAQEVNDQDEELVPAQAQAPSGGIDFSG